MLNGNDLDRARSALQFIPADLPRDQWLKAGMGLHAAGGSLDDFDQWSAQGDSYNAQACRATWRSFKSGKGIGLGTLIAIAREYGYEPNDKPMQRPAQAPRKAAEPPHKPASGKSAAEVWSRCEAATEAHDYVVIKNGQGVPLEGLRVVPADDPLYFAGQRLAGALVVPVYGSQGLLSLVFIPASGAGKLNLPGPQMAGGYFIVGKLKSGGVAYLCEGIGTAWACWQATGDAAVVCFGAGNMGKVAKALRQQDAATRLVLVPDVGMEPDAQKIAIEVGALVANMPQGEPRNFDANDLAKRDGLDALKAMLSKATLPSKAEPRYKLLTATDLREMPPLAWRVRGVLPAVGLAALYGPSASGKSFIAFDMAAAISEGRNWFNCRVERAPVVYAVLEGEAGFKVRAQAWEVHYGRSLPDGLHLIMQPFKLTEPIDVEDFAAVIPAGSVVFIDTLNRAAPTADENTSRDMGEILESAKQLQAFTKGLVVLVHHTGKDESRGLRGHSSLFAAMDAAIEVTRKGDSRNWKVSKSKDGQDGVAHNFRLAIEALGTDEYGDAITSCVVVTDTASQQVQCVKLPQGGNQKLVLEALRPLFKQGVSNKAGTPPLARCIELEVAVSAGAAALTCQSDRRVSRSREAISGFASRGVIGIHDGWLWMAA
jgi:putative DNA primase/helicase